MVDKMTYDLLSNLIFCSHTFGNRTVSSHVYTQWFICNTYCIATYTREPSTKNYMQLTAYKIWDLIY